MPISGLLITLSENATAAQQAVAAIAKHPSLEVGQCFGRWLPTCLDVCSDREGRAIHQWLESLEGVCFIDVVFVGFDDEGSECPLDS